MKYVSVIASNNRNAYFSKVEFKGVPYLRMPLSSPRENGCLIIRLTAIAGKYIFTIRLGDDQGSICHYFKYAKGTKDLARFAKAALNEVRHYVWRKGLIMQDIQNALVYNNVYSKLEDDGETSKLFEYTVDSQKSYIETNTWNTPQIC